MEFMTRYTRQSSAIGLHLVEGSNTVGRSLINSKNKSGPRTVPCGTPDVTAVLLEKHCCRPSHSGIVLIGACQSTVGWGH